MFGTSPIEPEYLLRELLVRVPVHVRKTLWRRDENTAWTDAVKDTLKELSSECSASQKCYYTKSEPGIKEFLLDIVWFVPGGASFGCECEWFYAARSSEESYALAVGQDFEKLLYFKAPLKLTILQARRNLRSFATRLFTKSTGI